MRVVMFDEMAPLPPAALAYLRARLVRPMQLATFFYLHAADAAGRLDAFEQQLQRRRLVAEHEAAEMARRFDTWAAVEAQSPYRSEGIH